LRFKVPNQIRVPKPVASHISWVACTHALFHLNYHHFGAHNCKYFEEYLIRDWMVSHVAGIHILKGLVVGFSWPHDYESGHFILKLWVSESFFRNKKLQSSNPVLDIWFRLVEMWFFFMFFMICWGFGWQIHLWDLTVMWSRFYISIWKYFFFAIMIVDIILHFV